MKLYYAPNSCALAPHIALEEGGVPYELVRVDLERREQRSAEFLALNPLGRVPVLETPRGRLTEVPAILTYVASLGRLVPLSLTDPFEAAELASFNAFLSSTIHVTFAHFARPYRWADGVTCRKEMSRKAVDAYAEQFALIERSRLRSPWVMGEHYTVADPYLFLMTRWLARIGLAVDAFPRIEQHHARMLARPAVRRVLSMH
jgi:glutathione S-transferase